MSASVNAFADESATGTTPEFRLSIKKDGIRVSQGAETLTYSSLWNGDADSTVTIRSGERIVAEGLQGDGTQTWSVKMDGEYTLTHTTMKDGVQVGETLTATFVVPSNLAMKDLKVTQIPPWGMAIDFDIEGAVTNYALEVKAITQDGAVTNVAKSLSGDVACSNGAHRVYWNTAKDGISIERERAVITVGYASSETPEPASPQGALYCIIDLSGGTNATAYAVTYQDKEPTGGFTNEVYKTTKVVLKRVEAGSFTMGDSSESNNQPHAVTLTKPFYMGLFEVTQRQWALVMGVNPRSSASYGEGDTYPVYYVSYDMIRGSSEGAKWPSTNSVDSTSFMGRLRAKTGIDFDLPTEAQWEYTCRAGTTTKYGYGDSADGDYMWYKDNSSSSYVVGLKKANPWGFYDMLGNLWEWCLDWGSSSLSAKTDPVGLSTGSKRVLRGGSWEYDESFCVPYLRRQDASWANSFYSNGFRLSLTP